MTRLSPDQFMAQLGLPEVYRVGGSVRDELLGRESKDSDYVIRGADLATLNLALSKADAGLSPLRLRDGRQVGMRAHVRGLGSLDIALPRTERSTGPGHRDFEIVVSPGLALDEDAVRRDFTINALYLDVHSRAVLDPLNRGIVALASKQIETTHRDSFRDDPLRILRALRFLSQLDGFQISPHTYVQMLAHADAVTGLTDKGVSGTALDELSRILMGRRPGDALRLARDTGVLPVLLPELAPMLGFNQRSHYHTKTTDEHTFDCLDAAAHMAREHTPLRVRMALLFHDAGKPASAWTDADGVQHYYQTEDGFGEDHEVVGAALARTALNRLNADSKLRADVATLIERHMLPLHENVKPFKVRRWRAELGDDLLRDLITHRLCDVIGKGGDIEEACDVLRWIEQVRQNAAKRGVPTKVKELPIGGRDLLALGLEGAAIGEVLRQLLHEVLSNPKLNDRDWLLRRAERLAKESA